VRYTVLSIRTIAVWSVLIVAAGVGMAVWLLLAYSRGDTEANRLRLDAIRTAGTVVVGTGGAAALLLAARRQRTAEITLAQKDRDQADAARTHALQERVAASTAADAEARRITDLYTKSADQLGSEKAPVRLAGMYALERLAQDNPGQRQTIANVLCAYLRMPFALSGDSPADDELVTTHHERTQEREVRLAVQRILIHHLRPGENPDDPDETFWADIDLDLTGAALINLKLDFCAIRDAKFTEATFTGHAGFTGVTFTRHALFDGATFTSTAMFTAASFSRTAFFESVTFTGTAGFGNANFTGPAIFDKAIFTHVAEFDRAIFSDQARFSGATFTGPASFDKVAFGGPVVFSSVTLPQAHYTGSGVPSPDITFRKARFARGVPPEVAGFVTQPDETEPAD
jgi:uncharacterized protein YjbI with pentapeptide repeats